MNNSNLQFQQFTYLTEQENKQFKIKNQISSNEPVTWGSIKSAFLPTVEGEESFMVF